MYNSDTFRLLRSGPVPGKKQTPPKTEKSSSKRPIEQYDHKSKTRINNPPVGLVTPRTDPPVTSRRTYDYDPHLDPQLVWAGKSEHTSFEVPTVSLHVHERIDPRTIIEAVRKRNGVPLKPAQGYLFESREENPPLREAVDFYRHPHGWTNRLIAGDSLLVMNSLLEKEGMAGQVQMVYIDPPYGIRYGSNFQPFVNRRDVKDGKDEDLTQEPEMVRAFRDTWELGIHSYLTYLRDRLLLARDLLHESGSCFVQISDENLHLVRNMMDDVFGAENFVAVIAFSKTTGFSGRTLSSIADFLVWYCKDPQKIKYNQLFRDKQVGDEGATKYRPISSYKSIQSGAADANKLASVDQLTAQRLMGATFDYYKLAHPNEGVGSGFLYKKVPHVTLKSIANNEPPGEETLYDQPLIDNSCARISGPFTVEAVPAPNVKSIDDLDSGTNKQKPQESLGDFRHAATPLLDASIARSGPTLRQSDWRDELLKTGIRGKGGQMINFSRVEPLGGTRWLHADAETTGAKPERVVISFGPEYAPLEPNQVEMAWEEARTLHPKPEILVFAAFQFDPEAAKDIDELTKEKTGMTFLTAQMNADLLTDDLKKKRSSNQSFWLVGRPDVDLRRASPSDLYIAEVRGFDYFDTRNGTIRSGGKENIAMWLLDTDYDGRSLYPRQVFFPLADEDEGWAKLARNLKAEIDPELIEHYRGTVSLPFALGEHKRVAVKVIDDRGIESLKVMHL
jgi:hypothetical protein